MDKISAVIIEDDATIRQTLKALFDESEEVLCVASFDNGEEAISFLDHNPVDVALFDIQLPGISGIECIARLKAAHPSMQFMVLTAYEDPDYVFKALRAGATGYILKNAPPDNLVSAIKELHGGGSPMSSQIARRVVNSFSESQKQNQYSEQLSRREKEILEQLSQGYRYKEIADKLFISVETVRTHIRNIYEKLQVNSRVDALRKTGML